MFQIKLKNGPFSFYEEVKIVKLSTDGALRTTTDGNQLITMGNQSVSSVTGIKQKLNS